MELSFRQATKSDVDFLMWLRTTTMAEHIEGAGLEVTPESLLERVNHYFESALVVQLGAQDIGLFKVQKHDDNWELVQIQMSPAYQGQGIGRQLISQLLADAQAANKPVILNVFKNNPAFKLYKSLGFFVYEETENAFNMKWQG